MITVAALWRHPIKSHGREAIKTVTLAPGQTMPWDRTWAVTHDKTKFDAQAPEWVACRNFMLGTLTPKLAGLWAKLDEDTRTAPMTRTTCNGLSPGSRRCAPPTARCPTVLQPCRAVA